MVLLLVISEASAESVLRVGLPSLPTQVDPHRALTASERLLARELFTGLVAVDDGGRIAPGLAETWAISPDGLSYAFALKPGLAWSDGRALTAQDIVDGLKRALDPATAAPFAAALLGIRNAEGYLLGTLGPTETLGASALDRRTVRIDLIAPSQRFLSVLAEPVAMPVPTHKIEQLKDAWAAPFGLVSNGAFVAVPAGDRFVLRRNPRFVDPVGVDRIELSVFESLDDAQAALRTRAIDLALGFVDAPSPGKSDGRSQPSAPGQQTYSIVVNADRPPLNQRELRHALGMVIDRDGLIKALRLGGAAPAYSVISPETAGYSSYRAPYARIALADRRVVARALLLDLDPRAVAPIRLAHPHGHIHGAIADAVASSWRELGFKVTAEPYPEAKFEAVLMSGDFDTAVLPTWAGAGGIERLLARFSQTGGPHNVARYREVSFDERLVQADVQANPDYRLGQLREAEGILIQDQVPWPLLFFPGSRISAEGIEGFQLNPTDLHPLRYIVRK